MSITDVAWSWDGHRRRVLTLSLYGQSLHITSGQLTALTSLGIVKGVVFLESERRRQLPNPHIQGDYAPTYMPVDLVGCTDDPRVFGLYQEMCEAIRAGLWHPGARPDSP